MNAEQLRLYKFFPLLLPPPSPSPSTYRSLSPPIYWLGRAPRRILSLGIFTFFLLQQWERGPPPSPLPPPLPCSFFYIFLQQREGVALYLNFLRLDRQSI